VRKEHQLNGYITIGDKLDEIIIHLILHLTELREDVIEYCRRHIYD